MTPRCNTLRIIRDLRRRAESTQSAFPGRMKNLIRLLLEAAEELEKLSGGDRC